MEKEKTLAEKIEMYRKVLSLLPKAEQESVILQINAMEFGVKQFIKEILEEIDETYCKDCGNNPSQIIKQKAGFKE